MAESVFDQVAAELLGDSRVSPAQMMGFRCLKVGRKMFAVEHDGALVVKLPRERVAELIESGEAERFDPLGNGRVMKEWARVFEPGEDAVSEWLALAAESREFVAPQG